MLPERPRNNIQGTGEGREAGETKKFGITFYITLLYLIFEFARPQSQIPVLGSLHIPGILAMLLVLALIFTRGFELRGKQTKLLIALLLLMAFHIPLAVNNYVALQMTRWMFINFIAYLSIVTFINNFRKFEIFVAVFVLINLYLAVVSIVQGGTGVGGFLGDENDLCLALNMAIPFTYFLFLESNNQTKKALFLIVTAVMITGIMMTFSRGGFLGLAAVFVYCWWKSPHKWIGSILSIFLLIIMVNIAPKDYWNEMETIKRGTADSTGKTRIELWGYAWEMFLDHPLGVGPGNYNWNIWRYERQAGKDPSEPGIRSYHGRPAHSLYFTLLSELGIIGVILFTLMLYHFHKRLKTLIKKTEPKKPLVRNLSVASTITTTIRLFPLRKAHSLALAINASLVGYLVSGVFISVYYYPNFWVLMAFSAALDKIVVSEQMQTETETLSETSGRGDYKRDLLPQRGTR